MTYRPRSSVTTILANLVGRSVVSAITQTPASGPLALVTTPPRSRAPIWIARSAGGWAGAEYYWGTIHYPDLDGDGKADVCGRASGGLYCAD